jgi:hypothetical protein
MGAFLKYWMPIASLILLVAVFQMIHFLSVNDYISIQKKRESFTSGSSHTVNLPLNTTYSCQNFCGPTARCAMTGQQCLADVDCPGCQPYSPPLPATLPCIPAANDGGKLTVGVTPQYSPLTSGYGTHETVVSNDPPAQANFGPKPWVPGYKAAQSLFDQRYKPGPMEFMPTYPNRYTTTGEFKDDGPLAANY